MLKKRGKIWYARFRHGGHETWISTHKTSEREARLELKKISDAIQRERSTKTITNEYLKIVKLLAREELDREECKTRLAEIERAAEKEAIKIVESMIPAAPLLAVDVWEKYIISSPELKESTMRMKRLQFDAFSRWAGNTDMKTLKESDCKKFLESLKTTKSQTWNNYISSLSSVWKQSPNLQNPWGEHLRMRSNVEHKIPLKREEIKMIVKHCAENGLEFWRLAVILAYYTGLRLKDVVFFSLFSIKDGYITLIPEKTDRTKRKVSIPVPEQLMIEIQNAKTKLKGSYFFPDAIERYQKNRAYISKDFQTILKTLNIYREGIGFHSIRHTFVTLAMDANIDIKNIQAAVGHNSIEITEGTYYHGIRHANLDGYPTL